MKSDGLARIGAACAIRSGEFGKAVEFLEQGRSTFWTQGLRLRTSLDSLFVEARGLAIRFKGLAHQLEQGSYRSSSKAMTSDAHQMSLDQEAKLYRQIQDNWDNTVSEIRSLGKYRSFLKPAPFHELQKAASNGLIVMLNATKSRFDVLIVTSSGVGHVPFPGLNPSSVDAFAERTRFVQANAKNIDPKILDQTSLQTLKEDNLEENQVDDSLRLFGGLVPHGPGDTLASVLKSLWVEAAQLVISHLQITVSQCVHNDTPPN